MADEALQHHHQAARPLAERAVGVLLQEGVELRPDLGQHRGHVVSGQRVAVVQIHHGVLQVAETGTDDEDRRDIWVHVVGWREHLKLRICCGSTALLRIKKKQRLNPLQCTLHRCLNEF